MRHLSNKLLLETYANAKELRLSELFIKLIHDEANDRSLTKEEADRFQQIRLYYAKEDVI